MAAENPVQPEPAEDPQVAAFKTEACLHSQTILAECRTCWDICAADAIHPGTPPEYDRDACQGCLVCVTVCPVGAFRGETSISKLLVSSEKAVNQYRVHSIDLICQQHPEPDIGPIQSELGLRVRGCLAHLGESAYLSLAALGLKQILVRLDACESCPWVNLRAEVQIQLNSAQKHLTAADSQTMLLPVSDSQEQEMAERPAWNADNPPISRADLFKVKTFFPTLETEGLSPDSVKIGGDRLSEERKRRIAALRFFPKVNDDFQPGFVEDENQFLLSITEECTACGVCAKGCPTKALDLCYATENSFELKFLPSACVGCKVCIKLCPEQAIEGSRLDYKYLTAEPLKLVLQSGKLKKCKKCKQRIADRGNNEYCSICAVKVNNPFSSKLPPGYEIKK